MNSCSVIPSCPGCNLSVSHCCNYERKEAEEGEEEANEEAEEAQKEAEEAEEADRHDAGESDDIRFYYEVGTQVVQRCNERPLQWQARRSKYLCIGIQDDSGAMGIPSERRLGT